jgi:hypothetical protein
MMPENLTAKVVIEGSAEMNGDNGTVRSMITFSNMTVNHDLEVCCFLMSTASSLSALIHSSGSIGRSPALKSSIILTTVPLAIPSSRPISL